jgi:hypothetical protein
MKCDICGKDDIKNMGVHKFQAHKDKESLKPGEVIPVNKLSEIWDYPKDERLGVFISEMKKLIGRFQNTIETKILEDGGIIKEITITARIRP